VHDCGPAAPWADSAALKRALQTARPDPCFGSITASSWMTADRARTPWVLCRPYQTTCPTAAVSVGTRRN